VSVTEGLEAQGPHHSLYLHLVIAVPLDSKELLQASTSKSMDRLLLLGNCRSRRLCVPRPTNDLTAWYIIGRLGNMSPLETQASSVLKASGLMLVADMQP
jgi:hypothetical protein